jgi:predicted acyltransferase
MLPAEQATDTAEATVAEWRSAAVPRFWRFAWPNLAVPTSGGPSETRFLSLDFLRGFTMFWIIGGSEMVIAVAMRIHPACGDFVETQLYHATWQGFTLLDMVMPVFLFLVGVSLPLALAKRLQAGKPLRPVYARIVRRFAVLWLLGIATQLMKQFVDGEDVALELFSNTLQAIAVGYLAASVAVIHLKVKGQIALLASLTVGYLALVVFVPFGGHPAGTLDRYANLPRYIDMLILGVFRRDHSFTWIASSMGFSATVLMGSMAGHILRSGLTPSRRILCLSVAGVSCLAAGWLWSYSVPLNRHLWSSSMIVWTGGWGFALVGLFYGLIDVAAIRRWAIPFIILGSNALLAYVLQPAFHLAAREFWTQVLFEEASPDQIYVLACGTELILIWLFLWGMFRSRIFLRA